VPENLNEIAADNTGTNRRHDRASSLPAPVAPSHSSLGGSVRPTASRTGTPLGTGIITVTEA
jgi:hypothetical protein